MGAPMPGAAMPGVMPGAMPATMTAAPAAIGMPGAPMPGAPMTMGAMPGMPGAMPGMPMMGGMMPMMGGMMPGAMPGMMPMMGGMMPGMNPMAMMMMASAMQGSTASEKSEESARAPADPPPEPIDSRVRDICRHFNIDDKICEKLNKAMKTREDFDEDMQVLWHIMEKGARNNKKAVDVMLVKIREITNGTFIGKDLLDPDIKDFAWKYNLDDQLLHRLIKTMKKRGKHKKQDLKDMDERIGGAKHPSGLLVRMLEGLEENGKMPPAPGWLVQSGHGGARREPADAKDRKKSRSRSR